MSDIYDVIIIGSGPAGLTAGIYASRADLKVLMFAGHKWGGQLMLTTEVENFPGFPEGILGPTLMENMRKQAERFGVKIIEEEVTQVDFKARPFLVGKETAKTVIIAAGAETKWLGLINEQRLIGRGVSSCAPCDAPFFRDKKVAVIGGGDAAMEEVQVLTKFASEVTLVHRGDTFRASKIMQERVMDNPKVKIIKNTAVEDILGQDRVSGIKLKNSVSGEIQELNVDGVFVAIGHAPVTGLFAGQLDLDEKGYVKSARHGKFTRLDDEGKALLHPYHTMTSVEGIFVAGDVHDFHYRQAITAAGYGCEAALEAERWLVNTSNS